MRKQINADAKEMLEMAGCTNIIAFPGDRNIGLGVHEMGTARMGRDPATSVLNGFNQAHDVPNLFVTDGACMTSSGRSEEHTSELQSLIRISYAVFCLRKKKHRRK